MILLKFKFNSLNTFALFELTRKMKVSENKLAIVLFGQKVW